jgi:hypothetical protein
MRVKEGFYPPGDFTTTQVPALDTVMARAVIEANAIPFPTSPGVVRKWIVHPNPSLPTEVAKRFNTADELVISDTPPSVDGFETAVENVAENYGAYLTIAPPNLSAGAVFIRGQGATYSSSYFLMVRKIKYVSASAEARCIRERRFCQGIGSALLSSANVTESTTEIAAYAFTSALAQYQLCTSGLWEINQRKVVTIGVCS